MKTKRFKLMLFLALIGCVTTSCSLDLHGTEKIYREPILKSVSIGREWDVYYVKIPAEIADMPLTAPLSIHTTFCLH